MNKDKIDILIITNLPAFYKINLFNRIAKYKRVFVIFTHDTNYQRNEDFYQGKRDFQSNSIANMSWLKKGLFLIKLLIQNPTSRLILEGWYNPIYWIAAIVHKKNRNEVIVESSVFESKTKGLKGLIKKLFLHRIIKVYASGESQVKLLEDLNFKGQIIKTKGVGIFNIVSQPTFNKRDSVINFIYVGRLSPEKNLSFLIQTFNSLPDLKLNIIGFGPEEDYLKSIAKSNVNFHGAISNLDLKRYYQQNDVFILPSISEPWGMVVEEALNNGLPVIVSDKVGCAEEIIKENQNGLIFEFNSEISLLKKIEKIVDVEYYNSLRYNISKMNFDEIANYQVNCYL